MATYRTSRNLEASLIDFIISGLSTGGWTGITVEKSFARVYEIELPVICVRLTTTTHNHIEIGDNATNRVPLIIIDIFAKNDGQRLDLKDFLISLLKGGVPYFDYVVSGNTVSTKTPNGRIRVLSIGDNPIDLSQDKATLDEHDKYRHQLVLTVNLGKVEA